MYFVESDHFDAVQEAKQGRKRKREEKKKKQKEKKTEASKPAKRFETLVQPEAGPSRLVIDGSQVVVITGQDKDDSSSESDSDTANDAANGLTLHVLPSRKRVLDADYKHLVMDAFINAATRRYCPRRVLNEYFENHRASKWKLDASGDLY